MSWHAFITKVIGKTSADFSRPKYTIEQFFSKTETNNGYTLITRPCSETPTVHYSKIASGNIVQKNPTIRDALNIDHDVIAIEMEGAGIKDSTRLESNGYLVIRGICDYCDGTKNDDWHNYAAAVAAAFTYALVQTLPSKLDTYKTSYISNQKAATEVYDYFVKPYIKLFSSYKVSDSEISKIEEHLHTLIDNGSVLIYDNLFYHSIYEKLSAILTINLDFYASGNFYNELKDLVSYTINIYSFYLSYERNSLLDFITSYLVSYINTLYKVINNGYIDEFLIIQDGILSIFNEAKYFSEQKKHSANLSIKSKIVSKKSISDFSSNMDNALPFEAEDGKKLKDVFIQPEYYINYLKNRILDDFDLLSDSFINGYLKKYLLNVGYRGTELEHTYRHMIILGSGGMGKSTLLYNLASRLQFKRAKTNLNTFFVKLSKVPHRSKSLLSDVKAHLQLDDEDMAHSMFILDAYDEFYLANDHDREFIISQFCRDIEELKSFSIITSRPGYFNPKVISNSVVINLCTFSSKKRALWINKYNINMDEFRKNAIINYFDKSDVAGTEFIGVPIILYMIAASKIDLSLISSKYEAYNKLFGIDGIWFNRKYDEKHPLLDSIHKEIYELILEIAFRIFNNSKGISINKTEIFDIINSLNSNQSDIISNLKLCFPLVTYFKNDSDLNEIEFAHKSIYEYYLSQAILAKVKRTYTDASKENILNLAVSLKGDVLSDELYDFFKEGLNYFNSKSINIKKTEELLSLFLLNSQDLFRSSQIENDIHLCNSSLNTFNIFSIILNHLSTFEYIDILKRVPINNLLLFIRIGAYQGKVIFSKFDLSKIDMSMLSLANFDFTYSNLSDANLSCSNLNGANFTGANMQNTRLWAATFGRAKLNFADIRGAYIESARFFKGDTSLINNIKIDIHQIQYFTPEIFLNNDIFLIYKNNNLLDKSEKAHAIRCIRGF